MSHEQLQRSAREHLLLHFTRNGSFSEANELLVLERGEGPYVFDTRGRRYIDALSSLYCAQLGYSYGQEMAEAATAQLRRLAFNTNWGTAHPASIELAERLAGLMPAGLKHCFFTSGGSEAVEAAWKLIREHFIAVEQPEREVALARETAYHGVTLGALSLTGVDSMKEGFGNPPIEVRRISSTNALRAPDGTDAEAFCERLLAEARGCVEQVGPERVAVIVLEPIQNAGGCIPPPPGYWRGMRRLADEIGAMLLADEVICGFGRLGEWLGVQREGVVPDIVTVAKGLTSAYAPMGAVIASEALVEPLLAARRLLRHGITFGGHPLAAAIAQRNIEIFERDEVLQNVRRLEPHLHERLLSLLELPIVGDVRGRGFFWAFELVADEHSARFDAAQRERLLRGYLPRRLLDAGIIARTDDRGDSVLQIAPPLICDQDILDAIVEALSGVLEDAGRHMGVPLSGRSAPARA